MCRIYNLSLKWLGSCVKGRATKVGKQVENDLLDFKMSVCYQDVAKNAI